MRTFERGVGDEQGTDPGSIQRGRQLMGWARIDDGFDDHPKVLALLEEEQGAAAVGLWTLCLTYAHRTTRKAGKTPGAIPSGLPRRYLGVSGRDLALLLVKVGLWDETPDGWSIHDFTEYLPSDETRARRAEAGRKGAAKRWGDATDDEARSGQADGNPMAAMKQNDGNLPSASHDVDSKAEANDGSRAPAHRDPVPVPEVLLPKTASPGAAKPRRAAEKLDEIDNPTAGLVVSEWIERCRKRPPGQTIARVGKSVKAMLAEGIEPDDIRRGIAQWMTRGLDPAALPSVVNEVMNSSPRASPIVLAASTAPSPIAADEVCPEHRGQRKGRCKYCRAAEIGVDQP